MKNKIFFVENLLLRRNKIFYCWQKKISLNQFDQVDCTKMFEKKIQKNVKNHSIVTSSKQQIGVDKWSGRQNASEVGAQGEVKRFRNEKKRSPLKRFNGDEVFHTSPPPSLSNAAAVPLPIPPPPPPPPTTPSRVHLKVFRNNRRLLFYPFPYFSGLFLLSVWPGGGCGSYFLFFNCFNLETYVFFCVFFLVLLHLEMFCSIFSAIPIALVALLWSWCILVSSMIGMLDLIWISFLWGF